MDAPVATIDELPDEVLYIIFTWVPPTYWSNVSSVCRRWYKSVKDPVLWKSVSFCRECHKPYVFQEHLGQWCPGCQDCYMAIREREEAQWRDQLDMMEKGLTPDTECVHSDFLKLQGVYGNARQPPPGTWFRPAMDDSTNDYTIFGRFVGGPTQANSVQPATSDTSSTMP